MSSIASVLQKHHLINEIIRTQMVTIQVLPPWRSITRSWGSSDCLQTLNFPYRGDDIWGETGKMRIFLKVQKILILNLYLLICKIRILIINTKKDTNHKYKTRIALAVVSAGSIQQFNKLNKACFSQTAFLTLPTIDSFPNIVSVAFKRLQSGKALVLHGAPQRYTLSMNVLCACV